MIPENEMYWIVVNIYEIKKSDWGTLVPRINVKNVIKLGFILE
jgi:hypothetical protein